MTEYIFKDSGVYVGIVLMVVLFLVYKVAKQTYKSLPLLSRSTNLKPLLIMTSILFFVSLGAFGLGDLVARQYTYVKPQLSNEQLSKFVSMTNEHNKEAIEHCVHLLKEQYTTTYEQDILNEMKPRYVKSYLPLQADILLILVGFAGMASTIVLSDSSNQSRSYEMSNC